MDEVKMDDMPDRAPGAPQHRTGALQVFRRMKQATTPLHMHLGPHKLEQNKPARLAEQKQLAVKKASLKFVGHPLPSQGSATGSATSVLSASVRAAHAYSDEPGCPTELAEANKQPPQGLKVFRKATAKSPKPLVKQQPNRSLKKVQSSAPPRPLQHAKLDGTAACAVSEPKAAETAPAWASTLGAGAAVAAAAAAAATSHAEVPPLERSFSEPPPGLQQLLAAVAADEVAAAGLVVDEPLHQQLKAAEECSAATRQRHRNTAAGCQMTCHTLLSQQQPSDAHCQHQQCHPQALQQAVEFDQGASALVSLLQTLRQQDTSSRQQPPASGLNPLQQRHRHQPQQPLLRQQNSTLAQLISAVWDERQQQQQIPNACLHLQQVHNKECLSAPADLAAENATIAAATTTSPLLVRDGSFDSEQSHGAATAPPAQAVAGSFTAETSGAASLEIVASVIRLLLQLTAMQVSPEAADRLRDGLTKAVTAAAAAVVASGQSFDLAAELNALVPTLQRAVVEMWVAQQTQEAVAAATAVVSLLSPSHPHAAATMAIAAAAGAAAGAAAAAGSHQPLPDVNAIFGSFVSGIEAIAEAGPARTKPAEESYAAAAAAAAATGQAAAQPSAEKAALLLAAAKFQDCHLELTQQLHQAIQKSQAGGSASVTAARLASWPHAGDDAGTSAAAAAAAADMEIDVANLQEQQQQQQQQHSVRLLRPAGRQVQHAAQRSNNSSCCLST